MSIVKIDIDTIKKEIAIFGRVEQKLLIDIMKLGMRVCGRNCILDGKRSAEIGATMFITANKTGDSDFGKPDGKGNPWPFENVKIPKEPKNIGFRSHE